MTPNQIAKFKQATMYLIDKHFPKGECKERGAAMVMYAEIFLALKSLKEPKP